MTHRRSITTLMAAVFLLATAATAAADPPAAAPDPPAAAPDPRATIEAQYKKIDDIIRTTTDEEAVRENIRRAMDDFVDFEMFGQLAASHFWDQMSAKERTEYLEVFKRLIQRTYTKRFKANKPFKVTLAEAATFNSARTKAEVPSTITSGDVAADVVYRLHVPAGRTGWWAYDVVIDDLSIMRNYRTSFIKMWKKGGFRHLMDTIRQKLDHVEKGDTDEGDDFDE